MTQSYGYSAFQAGTGRLPALSRTRTGIALFLAGIAFQCVMEAGVKWLSASYPIGQIIFFRSFLAYLPIAALVALQGDIRVLRPRRLSMLVLRGFLMVATIVLSFTGLKYLPLADAIAVFLLAPIFMAGLSAVLLRERLNTWTCTALGLGFVGALVMVKPGAGVFRAEALLPAFAALFYALVMIITRHLARSESTLAILVYGNLVVVLAGLASWPSGWLVPSLADAGLFLLIGVAGGFSVFFLTLALRYAQVGVLAPFDYTAFIWALGLGLLFWSDYPTPWVWLGVALILSSGLFVTIREGRSSRPAPGQPAS